MWKRDLLIVGLLLLGSSFAAGGASQDVRVTQPALVQFGQLLWVYSADGFPVQDAQGAVLLPVKATCELLGATCTVDVKAKTVSVMFGDQQKTVSVVKARPGSEVYAPLKALSEPLGFVYVWNSQTRRAVINRRLKQPGALSAIQGVIAGQQPRPVQHLDFRVNVKTSAIAGDPSNVDLSVSSSATLGHIWTYWKQASGGIGNASPVGCIRNATSTCKVTIQHDTRIVLIEISTP